MRRASAGQKSAIVVQSFEPPPTWMVSPVIHRRLQRDLTSLDDMRAELGPLVEKGSIIEMAGTGPAMTSRNAASFAPVTAPLSNVARTLGNKVDSRGTMMLRQHLLVL